MSLPKLGIQRHVMAFMVAFVVMLFGIIGYQRLGIDRFPDIDFPYITVVTYQEGAQAEIIDNDITKVLLDRLNSISGIDEIKGSSSSGVSFISISFDLDKDSDVAFNEVQARVSQSASYLPEGVDSPIIRKASIQEDDILTLVFSGDRSLDQLNRYAEIYIENILQTVNGVSEVPIYGDRRKEIKVDIDIYKMASLGLTVSDISLAMSSNHYQAPGGYFSGEETRKLLDLNLEFNSLEELKRLVIRRDDKSLIRLEDIANVYEGLEDLRSYSAFNSLPSLSISVNKVSGANVFAIEQEVINRLNDDILPSLAPDLSLDITSNSVDFIRSVFDELKSHIYMGIFLTAFVVFIFLRKIVPTIIVATAIPISLLGAIFVIYLFGYTLNVITLLGLLLLIGIVVDDAIIVLENIYRKIEKGMDVKKASIIGSNQIVFAVLASTISLVSIFGPVIFMEGIIGRFFQSFAVIVVCGVLISYFVSMYITPMLCSRYLKYSDNKGTLNNFLEKIFLFIEGMYIRVLPFVLKYRWFVLLFGILSFMSSFLFFSKVPGELTPQSDNSRLVVFLDAPSGSSIEYTISKLKQLETRLKQYDEIESIVSRVSSSDVARGRITANLVPISERDLSKTDFARKIQPEINQIAGAVVNVASGGGFGGFYPLSFDLTGPDLQALYRYSDEIINQMMISPVILTVDKDSQFSSQLKIDVNRDKMALLDITSREVVYSIASNIGGIDIGEFSPIDTSERYDIRLRGDQSEYSWQEAVKSIHLRTQNEVVRIDDFLKMEEFLGIQSIDRIGSLFKTTVQANPSGFLTEATEEVRAIAEQILPPGYNIEFSGDAKEFQETVQYALSSFLIAIILLYMVLASQFNSFTQPIVLMLSIPLAIVGAIFGLYITGLSLNIFSMIGIILLVGLVVKNAILLIDLTNELRKQEGYTILEALMEACPTRLRPILMTSLTLILTMLPAALARGDGSEENTALSVVVIGGMISSTILTLFIVPAAYLIMENIFEVLKKRKVSKLKETKMLKE